MRSIKPLTASLHTVRVVRTVAKLVRQNSGGVLNDSSILKATFELLGNLPPTDASLLAECQKAVADSKE